MIYLIMVVLSTIAMPSCAVTDLAFQSARTKQADSPPIKQSVSPLLTSLPSPDRTSSTDNGRRPHALYPLYGKQESSTFALEEHPFEKDKIVSKNSRNRKLNHKGETAKERSEVESPRTNGTFREHQSRIRPHMKFHHLQKTLVSPALDIERQNRSSSRHSIKIHNGRLISITNEVERSSIGVPVEDWISEDRTKEIYDSRKQTSRDPASLKQSSRDLASLKQTSIDPTSINQTSTDPASLNQTSRYSASLKQTSRDPASLKQSSRDLASLKQTSIDPASINQTSADPASLNQTSRYSANLKQTSRDPASLKQSNINPASLNQTSTDPASLTVLSDLYNLTTDVSRTISDRVQNGPICDKVKRSADTQKLEVEVPGASGHLQRSSVSLQEPSDDTGIASLANPDRALVPSNVRDSGGTTKSTRRGTRRRRGRRRQQQSKTLALWIDQQQVKLFSGYMMEIFVIHEGKVLPYILDPNFEKHLPVIPYEVQRVNFTWQAGRKRYYYTFDRLYSHNPEILEAPVVSLAPTGRIPRKPKVFTVNLSCFGNASGIASFDIGLLIQTQRGKPLAGTPLRLKLRKECTQSSKHNNSYGVDPECDEKCENGGVCDVGRKCQCPEGYMGPYCNTALCYPQCMNGGTCTTPGRCKCPPGYQGRHCEGGICRDKCENGGKCIQKDTCACSKGYYGNRCEFSKCVIPCINGGRCRNVNKCRCPRGFAGDHCEVVTGHNMGAISVVRCSRKCRHGSCTGTKCICEEGFTGKWCRRRGTSRKRVWM